MGEIKWTNAQKEAIEALGNNILVSAAAGSGKTAVLVERVIRLITRAEDPCDIDSLVVMTFTKAAAAQMKSKIYQKLREELGKQPDNAYLRQQMMKVTNARICTIDSLCSQIVREHFQDIDLDPAFRMADDAQMRLLRAEVLSAVIEEMYLEGSPEFLELADYYTDKNDKALERIVLTLYDYARSHPEPEAWLRGMVIPYQMAAVEYSDEEDLSYPEGMDNWMPEFVRCIQAQMEKVQDMALAGLQISQMNYGPAPYEPVFENILELCQKMEGEFFDNQKSLIEECLDGWKSAPRITAAMGVDPDLKKAAMKYRDEIKTTLQSLQERFFYEKLDELYRRMGECLPVARAICDLTLRFSEELDQVKKEKKMADFSDIAHGALKILIRYNEQGEIIRDEAGNPVYTDVADQMAREIREVIVDEYQDTNMLQEYLVMALSAERFGRPDVFMVGDVKQSIYRFRMACPELFNEKLDRYEAAGKETGGEENGEEGTGEGNQERIAKEGEGNGGEGTGGEKVDANGKWKERPDGQLVILDSNFRSRKEVLDLTNTVFEQIMVRKTGGIDYRSGHTLTYGGLYGPSEGPEKDFLPEILMVRGGGDDAKYQEAYLIASRIEELVAEGRYHFSDIVILTRASDNPQLEKVLYRRGIPIAKNTGKGFFDTFEVRLVLDLLKVIDNPLQDIPLVAVLYSPLCSATADDLARIRLAGEKYDKLYDCLLKYRESSKFDWLKEKLPYWQEKAAFLGTRDLLNFVLQDSGLELIISAMPQGEDRRANLEFLKSMAEEHAEDLFSFLRYIHNLQEGGLDFGTLLASESVQAVRMMTIHHSKGLEFPVVFLAAAGKLYNETDSRSSILPDRSLGLGIESRDTTNRILKKTILMETILEKQKMETRAEEMRLLYVAMTRAKEKLIITGSNRNLTSAIEKWERSLLTSGAAIGFTSMDESPAGAAPMGEAVAEATLSCTAFVKPWEVMGANNYLSLLGMVLHPWKDRAEGFRLEYVDPEDAQEIRAEELLLNAVRKEELLSLSQAPSKEEIITKAEDRDVNDEGLCETSAAAAFREVQEQLEFRYPYENAVTIDAKMSVSSIKNKSGVDVGQSCVDIDQFGVGTDESGADAADASEFKTKSERMVDDQRSLSKGKKLRGAELGTAYHDFLEHYDYQGPDLEEQLRQMEEKGWLDPEACESIDLEVVQTFLQSPLGTRMAKAAAAGTLYREKQFMIGYTVDVNSEDTLTGAGIKSDIPDEELLLVQGRIDAWFIEEGSVILVDYKTDQATDEEHYRHYYEAQLDQYAQVLTRCTGMTVKEKMIYSFVMGKAVVL